MEIFKKDFVLFLKPAAQAKVEKLDCLLIAFETLRSTCAMLLGSNERSTFNVNVDQMNKPFNEEEFEVHCFGYLGSQVSSG